MSTLNRLQELLPEEAIRDAFMKRPDIAPLPAEEREARWLAHREHAKKFLEILLPLPWVKGP